MINKEILEVLKEIRDLQKQNGIKFNENLEFNRSYIRFHKRILVVVIIMLIFVILFGVFSL